MCRNLTGTLRPGKADAPEWRSCVRPLTEAGPDPDVEVRRSSRLGTPTRDSTGDPTED